MFITWSIIIFYFKGRPLNTERKGPGWVKGLIYGATVSMDPMAKS